ncbi:MAG: hypothetical protein ACFFAN_09625, partial [Promethearchaeota archaeon]
MCGCCRLTLIQDEKEITKFACIDGPLFDGHLIKWDELISRGNRYNVLENYVYQNLSCKALENYKAGDINK